MRSSAAFIPWLLSLLVQTGQPTAAPSGYSAWMADSVIARGQAVAPPGKPESSVFLQIGFFQTAILRLLNRSDGASTSQIDSWEAYLANGTASIASRLVNASQDTQFPLDRLSMFRGLLHE